MIEMKLYTGGGVSFSPVQREGSVESDYVRLVADEGYAITNGDDVTTVIDVPKADVSNWSDCALPTPPDPDPDIDDSEALGILLGGDTE
nr:MAG TPA: hypothetical protein [Bacteriophage sp.]